MPKRVVIAMSGGVDSSAAACILLRKGYDVVGVTMQIWQDESLDEIEANNGCCGLGAVDDARRVADTLGIPYYVLNLKSEFKKYVIDYFKTEYLRGRTPNPCIACNSYVKWESLLKKSLALGADYIATGHYARISTHPKTGRLCLESVSNKDQSYALYALTQEQLSRTLLPVGEYTKPEIRELARSNNLSVFDKPDSQEICFVPDGNYASHIPNPAQGNFLDDTGKIIGRHNGIVHYTIGQRKGLGAFGKPMFVRAIDAAANTVTLSENVQFHEMSVSNINWMAYTPNQVPTGLSVKIRYSHNPSLCEIKIIDDNTIHCIFDEPQRAVTPGQAAVFYEGSSIVCGGIIEK